MLARRHSAATSFKMRQNSDSPVVWRFANSTPRARVWGLPISSPSGGKRKEKANLAAALPRPHFSESATPPSPLLCEIGLRIIGCHCLVAGLCHSERCSRSYPLRVSHVLDVLRGTGLHASCAVIFFTCLTAACLTGCVAGGVYRACFAGHGAVNMVTGISAAATFVNMPGSSSGTTDPMPALVLVGWFPVYEARSPSALERLKPRHQPLSRGRPMAAAALSRQPLKRSRN